MNKMTHTRERYQAGSLKIEKRRTGGDVWIYRWREYRSDGTSTYRKRIVGLVSELRTKSAAHKAIEGLKLDINAEVTKMPVTRTVAELISHYEEVELASGKHTLRVRQVYKHNLNDLILPRWGDYRLQDVTPVAVERWLAELPYAPATRTKVKGVFGTLFRHGMRYQWVATNPIALVRSSSKRVNAPDILTPLEIQAIVAELSEPARTVTKLAAITGMRRGELFGLKWQDLDFHGRAIHIRRSLVDQVEGLPKTETSRKPLPMSDGLAVTLSSWRERTDYAQPEDWVFASPVSFGEFPYWPDMMLRRHILPAATRLGIRKRIGWHTFRRTAATLLMSSGSSLKTTQELMRHATADITMELYAQAITEEKRQAQNALAALISGPAVALNEADSGAAA
ncbi:Site-specific recombinase XerD [Bryocella elongata]|uniref:Site-specific recombinase XerD n=1 Tax=Bryocella elongata TaxID=863522 RepID=A0A1H6AGM0_9BACT|nr:site-specific integrase [Bryocella elongata]SEG46906.1 Site-specific recombinase XerD [Bryocella elongata]